MGFFSWKTLDSNRSICNNYSDRSPFKVIMSDNKGNQWIEENYEGYGIFGGKDYYELLDEMNGGSGDRGRGINLEFHPEKFPEVKKVIFPSLTESGHYYQGKRPENCEYQGYFYPEMYDEDEDYDDWEDELDDTELI